MLRFDQIKHFYLLISVVLIVSCNSNTQVAEKVNYEKDLQMANPVVKREAKSFRPEIRYTVDSLRSAAHLDSLLNNFSEKEIKNILALNRMDRNRLRPGKKFIVPECASAEFKDFSPFPENISFMKCVPKTVLISQRVQAFGLYENGKLVKWGPVSTGKNSTRTPNGLNYGNYKAREKVSTVDKSWVLPYYFNFMNFEGIGTHQYALPGYPASHGCVRMYMDDAKYIFDWARMWEVKKSRIVKNGTPFIVFGQYDYGAERPWLNLNENMKANDLKQGEIDELRAYIDQYHSDPRNSEEIIAEENNGALAKA